MNRKERNLLSYSSSYELMETWFNYRHIFWGAPKSLQMVTAAMKLKDACFLGEKL